MIRHRKRTAKRWLIGGALIILSLAGGAVYLVIHKNFSGAAMGTGSKVTLTEPLTNQFSFNAAPVTVNDQYISFQYPKAFRSQGGNPTDSIDLASYRFTFHAIETWQLAVAVERLPGPSLKNDSGYVYRTLHPEKYRASSLVINNRHYSIMTDTSQPGFNEVAYTDFHGNLVGLIALSGYDSSVSGDMTKTFNMVLGSWQWH